MTWLVRQRAQWGQASLEKTLGALPVVAAFCSRLRIRELVDTACPVRDTAELTHGQVIEGLVANRLTSPAPLVHVQDWARDWAVGEAFGTDPELLNDVRWLVLIHYKGQEASSAVTRHDPGHRSVTPDHPTPHRPPTPSPGPSGYRSTRPPVKITHVRKTGLARSPSISMTPVGINCVK
ncbi:DUF4277 domain-containing protein [Nonomuraea muscovyensis]